MLAVRTELSSLRGSFPTSVFRNLSMWAAAVMLAYYSPHYISTELLRHESRPPYRDPFLHPLSVHTSRGVTTLC
jgi:hypothetical protein